MYPQTCYRNTDLELKSPLSLSALCGEFAHSCHILHHTQDKEGNWCATIESSLVEDRTAADDIQAMLAVIPTLTAAAQKQWNDCYFREFDLGFDCGDTWAYRHTLSLDIIQAVAEANCSLSVTLYPPLEDG
ncbi:MAG: hypothetical protein WA949_08720 [Phormidesmis sp.]